MPEQFRVRAVWRQTFADIGSRAMKREPSHMMQRLSVPSHPWWRVHDLLPLGHLDAPGGIGQSLEALVWGGDRAGDVSYGRRSRTGRRSQFGRPRRAPVSERLGGVPWSSRDACSFLVPPRPLSLALPTCPARSSSTSTLARHWARCKALASRARHSLQIGTALSVLQRNRPGGI
jgi:hypothetical protein